LLARVLGHSATKIAGSRKRDACFALPGESLRADFGLSRRRDQPKPQVNPPLSEIIAPLLFVGIRAGAFNYALRMRKQVALVTNHWL
jgi:hypothetical protein